MSIHTASLHKLIKTVWDAENLDAHFTQYWSGVTGYAVLHDGEATPGQPFPYCVFEAFPLNVAHRTTGTSASSNSYIISRVPVTFNVHAKPGEGKSAKKVASELVEDIMAVFGGHPSVGPADLGDMDNGCLLIAQYTGDQGIRTGDEEYRWMLDYTFMLDLPVRT